MTRFECKNLHQLFFSSESGSIEIADGFVEVNWLELVWVALRANGLCGF
jgi:hypothetical protein